MHKPAKITDKSLSNAKDYMAHMAHIGDFDQECFIMVSMSPDRRIIGDHIIGLGGFHDSYADASVVFNRLISDKAYSFIIAHNHPNGVGIFSQGDVLMTIKLLLLSQLLGFTMLNHILFPHKRLCVSMKTVYPKLWTKDYLNILHLALEKHFPKKAIEKLLG